MISLLILQKDPTTPFVMKHSRRCKLAITLCHPTKIDEASLEKFHKQCDASHVQNNNRSPREALLHQVLWAPALLGQREYADANKLFIHPSKNTNNKTTHPVERVMESIGNIEWIQ
mmetsp:Transcript_10819/g.14332  ORF Transcript_10819/g.14332 Transcript_10819/m.14332 type:complete len:116 (+) Transcript_10819:863-1210(+)